ESHAALIRRHLPEDEANQGRFARAVRADEPDAIAAHDARREPRDQLPSAEAFADVRQLRDELARALAGIQAHPHRAEALAPRSPLPTQLLQSAHPSFVAGATRLDSLADPDLLLRPELVEAAVGNVFGGQLLLPSRFVSREIPRVGAQHAAVELYDPRGDTVEEGAIVGDHDRRRNLQQQLLQPLDGADIEVIRRLIEQQQVRLSGERKGERRTLALAARARRRRHPGLELEAMQELRQASLEAPALALIVLQGNARKCRGGGRCALQQTFAQRVRRGKLRLLLDESDVKSLPYLSLAVIQHGEPG